VAQHSLDFPTECGSAKEFEREVAARLGELRLPATSARIEPSGHGFRLSMSVAGEQRELRDRDCRELFRAAVVVAVAIAVSEAEPGAKPAGQQSKKRNASAPSTPAPLPTSVEPREPALRAFVVLGGGATLGVSPGIVPSLDLETKLLVHRLGVALEARYVAPGSSLDAANRGVEVSAVGGAMSALFQPIPVLEARLGVSVLRVFGTGLGSSDQRSDAAWGGGVTAGLGVFPLRRERWWVGARAEAEWHLIRPRFEILNYGEVFRVPSFGGSGSARLGFRFF
jgi:hypothetical protein